MSDPRQVLGIAAEDAVAAWLERSGWRILARRLRTPGGGEVDLLATDADDVLVAVEVRARRTGRSGPAAATVDRRRIQRLRRTLVAVAPGSGAHRGLRIDLVTVEPLADQPGRWRLMRIPLLG